MNAEIKQPTHKTCAICGKTKEINNYYVRDKVRVHRECKDCTAKKQGTKERGVLEYYKYLKLNGLRRCHCCKKEKPLTKDYFAMNKSCVDGIDYCCKECMYKKHKQFMVKQSENIGDSYAKQWAVNNFGIATKDIDSTILEISKLTIQAKRELKYNLDGKEFKTLKGENGLCEYILKTYDIPQYTSEARIRQGFSEQECTIPEYWFRSMGQSERIKITDLITQEEFIFNSHKEAEKMFAGCTITRCLKHGIPTKGTRSRKYKNSCKIERL